MDTTGLPHNSRLWPILKSFERVSSQTLDVSTIAAFTATYVKRAFTQQLLVEDNQYMLMDNNEAALQATFTGSVYSEWHIHKSSIQD